MNRNMEERLPQVVEERLQEAYESIRRGEIKQMKQTGKKKRGYRSWASIAASLAIIVAVPSVVYAAVSYFQKSEQREADKLTYEFELNYDLVPGEYQVRADYLPEGMTDGGDGKYYGENYGEDDNWITVMPIYTMAELEKADGEIVVNDIGQVEHMELAGMTADVITFKEAEKYRSSTYIFLFNEREGYVLNVIAGYSVEKEELLKFTDGLSVERTGDGRYETEEETALREKEGEDDEKLAAEASELMLLGIPQDKIYAVGEELSTYDGAYGYTVTGYEFLDSIEGFEEKDFFDYTRFDGWLNPDKTLRPYTRQHYDKDGQLLEEEKAAQQILRVDIDVHCYDDQWEGASLDDVELDFQLDYVEKNQDGAYTWAEDYYTSIPAEEYCLQMDNSAVYMNKAVHTQGEERKGFFFSDIEKGETISYTLLFVVDTDRKDDFLLSPVGSNYSRWVCEGMTAEECRDELDGYIQLK